PPHHRDLHSFPTRRSSDLWATAVAKALSSPLRVEILRSVDATGSASPSEVAAGSSHSLPSVAYHVRELAAVGLLKRGRTRQVRGDRKSTRLNSSHLGISYA